jgi:hypothetical protein
MPVFKSKAALPRFFAFTARSAAPGRRDDTAGIIATRTACPASRSRPRPATSPCSTAANSRDAARSTWSRHHQRALDLRRERRNIVTNATFDVHGQRRDAARRARGGAALISRPWFRAAPTSSPSASAGSALRFADGQLRASTSGTASARCSAPPRPCRRTSAARSPASASPGDADAALDPMADPAARPCSAASFELLVGFQLTQEQLAYNATR